MNPEKKPPCLLNPWHPIPTMTNAPRLLDKLVSLTAIHDVELMEFSLLKTLEEFIRPQELLILKLDRHGRPCYQLRLRQDSYEITVDDISIAEEILAAIDMVRSTGQSFNRRLPAGAVLTLWPLLHLKTFEVVLVTITAQPLSKLDLYLVNGMLGVYRNFFTVLNEAQRDAAKREAEAESARGAAKAAEARERANQSDQ